MRLVNLGFLLLFQHTSRGTWGAEHPESGTVVLTSPHLELILTRNCFKTTRNQHNGSEIGPTGGSSGHRASD